MPCWKPKLPLFNPGPKSPGQLIQVNDSPNSSFQLYSMSLNSPCGCSEINDYLSPPNRKVAHSCLSKGALKLSTPLLRWNQVNFNRCMVTGLEERQNFWNGEFYIWPLESQGVKDFLWTHYLILLLSDTKRRGSMKPNDSVLLETSAKAQPFSQTLYPAGKQ